MLLKQLSLTPDIDVQPLQDFVRTEIIPGAKQRDQSGQFPIEIYRSLHQLGWLQAPIPQALGGSGASTSDLLWIGKELAYGSCGIFTSVLGHWLGVTAITQFAHEPLRKKLSLDLLERFSLTSFCMTEPNAGTDIVNISTTAHPTSGGYRLSGKKCFITNANHSEHIVVFAKVPTPGLPSGGITAFYLDARSPGVQRGVELKKLGQKESNTSEFYFDNVFIPEDQILGQEGQGLKILRKCIQRSKTLIAGGAVGAATRAGELATQHLSHREHYGTTLLKLHTVNTQLAELYTELEASWLLALLAAASWDNDQTAVKEASMAKVFASDMATRFVSECLEFFGGYGYSTEYEIEKIYRDVRGFEIFEGATLVQLSLIAKEVFPGLLDPIAVKQKPPTAA